jgi:hypothetical protein
LTLLIVIFRYTNSSRQELATIITTCSIDKINGAIKVENVYSTSPNSKLVLQGWTADKTIGVGPNSISIIIFDSSNKVAESSALHEPTTLRPDVALALNAPGVERSGFNIHMVPGLNPGKYGIIIKSTTDDQPQYCSTNSVLDVQP